MAILPSFRLGGLALVLAPALALASDAAARPPPMPTFSATVAVHRLALAEVPGAHSQRYFNGVTIAFDSATGSSMFQLVYSRFGHIGPAFEYLAARQVAQGGTTMYLHKNGSLCSEGPLIHLETMDKLFPQLLRQGTHVASGEVDGRSCDIWHVGVPSVGNLSACIRSDGVPLSVLAEPSISAVGFSNIFSFSQNWTFHDILVGNKTGNVRIEPIVCPAGSNVRKACVGKGVDSFQVLRATFGEPFGGLADRDTFDWPGVGVTLGAPGAESFIFMKYLEVFDVEADTAFGPMRDCNFDHEKKEYVCRHTPPGELARLVSRSSAEQLTGKANSPGQCDANELVGSWLVFPSQGECGERESIGYGNCTWKSKGAVKVVEMECVRSFGAGGWARAWKEDYQKAPFPNVMRAVKLAVEGCPDVRLPRLI